MQTLMRGPTERTGWGCAAALLVLLGCGGRGEAPRYEVSLAAAATPVAAEVTAGAAAVDPLYQRCITCHQANGEGVPGAFPPLAGSEFVKVANPAAPIRVVMYGMQGPVKVKGKDFNGVMPAGGTGVAMSDEEIASVLTYIRSSWGNNASAVTAEQVAAERAATAGRKTSMTFAELKPLLQ